MKVFTLTIKNFNKYTTRYARNKLSSKNFTVTEPTSIIPNSEIKQQTPSAKIRYKFNYGYVKIPHFSKKDKGGEDALAVHEGMICVADGVGGWNEMGVDPSKYSNELCDNIKKEYLKNGHLYFHTPKKLFVNACKQTKSMGSATFCMNVLDLEKEYLHGLNLGDSGYMLVRGRNKGIKNPNKALHAILDKNNSSQSDTFDIVFRTEEQQHSFNFPFQVGTEGDNPESAETHVHKIEEHDIIILATDGLWDNLFEHQILKILKPFYEISNQLNDLNTIAEMIGQTCQKYSLDQRYKSPFCVRSKGLYLGGKPDDITVIVAQIVKND